MAVCGSCGQQIDEPLDILPNERIACPNCGSKYRAMSRGIGSNIPPHGTLIAHKNGADGSQAVRVTDSQSRSSAIDLDTNGTLTSFVQGTSPRNEEGIIEACSILAQHLNMRGGHWGAPEIPTGVEGGVDCILRDQQEELHIQVTRVVPSRDFWRQLGQSGTVTEVATVQNASDDLLSRAQDKARRMPRHQLADIDLVIDARDTSGHSLRPVVIDFRQRHASVLNTLGFKAVWVVGPTTDLTERLDR